MGIKRLALCSERYKRSGDQGKVAVCGFQFQGVRPILSIKSRSYSKDLQIRAEHLNCSGFALSIDWGFRLDSLISA